MNITEIKAQLGMTSLPLTRGIQKNAQTGAEEPTEWLRYWDNVNRISIIMHQNVMSAAQADSQKLVLKAPETKVSQHNAATGEAGKPYTQYVIIEATIIEVVL